MVTSHPNQTKYEPTNSNPLIPTQLEFFKLIQEDFTIVKLFLLKRSNRAIFIFRDFDAIQTETLLFTFGFKMDPHEAPENLHLQS